MLFEAWKLIPPLDSCQGEGVKRASSPQPGTAFWGHAVEESPSLLTDQHQRKNTGGKKTQKETRRLSITKQQSSGMEITERTGNEAASWNMNSSERFTRLSKVIGGRCYVLFNSSRTLKGESVFHKLDCMFINVTMTMSFQVHLQQVGTNDLNRLCMEYILIHANWVTTKIFHIAPFIGQSKKKQKRKLYSTRRQYKYAKV